MKYSNGMDDGKLSDHETEARMSRSRQNRRAALNLPGILVTGLFLLVEGWFFLRLLRFQMVPGKFMVLIVLGLLLLAVGIDFLCWNFKRKARFIIGVLVAVTLSVGMIIGANIINKTQNSMKQWQEPSTEMQQVTMDVYVLKEDTAASIEDLSGAVIGILETAERDEAEQVLDDISLKMKEQPQVRTYSAPAEAVNALYSGEVRAIILAHDYIATLANISGFSDVTDKIRLITDFDAERPTQISTLPGESAASTAADASEKAEDPTHGTRSWILIKHATSESTEASGEVIETEAPSWTAPIYTDAPIGTTPPPTQPPTAGPITVPQGQEGRIFTIYISGLDTRGGGLADRGNSDVNILAVVNMNSRQVLLLNTPRDYFVAFPSLGGTRDKLTHAGYYGVQASMDALRNLYGVTGQYYFRVGFDGLKTLIDAMGGVTVYSSYEFDTGSYQKLITDPESSTDESAEPRYETAYRYHFNVGNNTVDGAKALAFARERRHLPGGDRDRGGNQLALIKAVISKLASFSTIANLDQVMSAVGGLARTTVPYETIAAFGRSVLGGESWNIASYNVNGSGGLEYCPSIGTAAYVMYPNWGTVSYAQNLIRQVYNGDWVSP